jgi:hypothetical protein
MPQIVVIPLNEKFTHRFAEATSQELHWYWSEDYIDNIPLTPSSPYGKIIATLHSGKTQ